MRGTGWYGRERPSRAGAGNPTNMNEVGISHQFRKLNTSSPIGIVDNLSGSSATYPRWGPPAARPPPEAVAAGGPQLWMVGGPRPLGLLGRQGGRRPGRSGARVHACTRGREECRRSGRGGGGRFGTAHPGRDRHGRMRGEKAHAWVREGSGQSAEAAFGSERELNVPVRKGSKKEGWTESRGSVREWRGRWVDGWSGK